MGDNFYVAGLAAVTVKVEREELGDFFKKKKTKTINANSKPKSKDKTPEEIQREEENQRKIEEDNEMRERIRERRYQVFIENYDNFCRPFKIEHQRIIRETQAKIAIVDKDISELNRKIGLAQYDHLMNDSQTTSDFDKLSIERTKKINQRKKILIDSFSSYLFFLGVPKEDHIQELPDNDVIQGINPLFQFW
jgi:hypothetical protein